MNGMGFGCCNKGNPCELGDAAVQPTGRVRDIDPTGYSHAVNVSISQVGHGDASSGTQNATQEFFRLSVANLVRLPIFTNIISTDIQLSLTGPGIPGAGNDATGFGISQVYFNGNDDPGPVQSNIENKVLSSREIWNRFNGGTGGTNCQNNVTQVTKFISYNPSTNQATVERKTLNQCVPLDSSLETILLEPCHTFRYQANAAVTVLIRGDESGTASVDFTSDLQITYQN